MNRAIKCILATVLAISVLATGLVCSFAAEASDSMLTSDQEGFLRFLGIIGEETPAYNKILTRGELAHMAARIANLPEYSGENIYFYDVPEDHEYFSDIHALAEQGIISGDGNGSFRPDDAVADLEICKVFSVILGYDELGEFSGYLRTARDAGIISSSFDGSVTVGDALQMAYNTLHCEMMEAVSYGETRTYKVQKEFLAIERYHKLVQQKGIVEGIYGTTLEKPNASIPENILYINKREFSYTGGDHLLGYSVVFYAKRDSNGMIDSAIQYIAADGNLNQTKVIDIKDVVGKDKDAFRYYDGSKEKELRVSAITDVIINGIAYPGYTNEDLKTGTGTLTLIDNNNDGVYDVISADSYQFLIVDSVSTGNKVIYGKYPKVTIGDADRESYEVSITGQRDGLKFSYERLTSGQALALKQSKNTEGLLKIQFELIGSSVQGTVDSILKNTISVGGVSYELLNSYITDWDVKTGDFVTVYTYNGAVAIITHQDGSAWQLGYLLNARYTGAFDGTLHVQVVTAGKTLAEYNGAKKVELDGVSYSSAEKILEQLSVSAARTYQTAQSKWPYSQLVRYKVNSKGEISHLDSITQDYSGDEEDSLRLDCDFPSGSSSRQYFNGNRSFYDMSTQELKFGLESSHTAFIIPNTERDQLNMYQSRFSDTGGYRVEGYNMDPDTGLAKYAVAYTDEWLTPSGNQTPGIVTDVETVLNDEGEIVKRITVRGNGTHTLKIDPELNVDHIAIGDVILWADGINSLHIINVVEHLAYDAIPAASARAFKNGSSNAGSAMGYQVFTSFGTPLVINSEGMMVHTTSLPDDGGGLNPTLNKHIFDISKCPVYIYDTTTGKAEITTGRWANIQTHAKNPGNEDKVFVVAKYGTVVYTYVIR